MMTTDRFASARKGDTGVSTSFRAELEGHPSQPHPESLLALVSLRLEAMTDRALGMALHAEENANRLLGAVPASDTAGAGTVLAGGQIGDLGAVIDRLEGQLERAYLALSRFSLV